ncbi:hypothetical protein CCR94_05055 [Rhodoblastus sphagnicola]|uniref:Polysaccharide pyruvyl transferase domain-containing protein n=1 Tax=Rhodoblastus sphagnicola TaxID=333368 RepID=A0A2S6ND86_9HYPH|nr:polysaccharide pyruvyl transferase family protein [Rhodoblastus sphagnicola]MBB4198014.1 hypothetical protein [Rhodoblastus sphagnicola]PPQ32551.1 hypothetical protein CCR94_05055 [Rhodoblastus sphagnicola]
MKIFLLGATPSFELADTLALRDRLALTGGNTGNQIIAHGLLKPLAVDALDWSHAKGPAYVQQNFDHILIAAANFLHTGFDFGGMARFIEQTTLPVAIVGLGAQSNTYNPKIDLHPGTRRFVKVIAERCVKIGVRGAFTAEVLADMGVDNVQVVGCPSYYMNGSDGVEIRTVAFDDATRVAVNGSRDVVRHSFDQDKMLSALHGLMAEALRYDALFVAQTEAEEITIADHPGSPQAQAAADRLVDFYRPSNLDMDGLRDWALRRSRVFWSVDNWLDAMRQVDFVVGTRFHGAIAALSVGTPAFVLCHDTRTMEMCEFLGLPHGDIRALDKIDFAALHAGCDFAAFRARQRQLTWDYARFLDENGLKHHFARVPAA